MEGVTGSIGQCPGGPVGKMDHPTQEEMERRIQELEEENKRLKEEIAKLKEEDWTEDIFSGEDDF